MLAVAAVAIALSAAFYWRAFRMVAPRQWWILLALRVSAILLVVLLLFRPVLSYNKDSQQQPAVIFLVGPLGVDEHRRRRHGRDAARPGPATDSSLVGRAGATIRPARRSRSAERARPLDDVGQLDAVAPDGQGTSLSRALVAAAELLPRRDVEAVVLLSDGIHNSARNPLDVAAKMGVVVYTVGVGASLRSDASYRDVQVTGIDCPDRLMLNNLAKITASVEGVELAGRVVQVALGGGRPAGRPGRTDARRRRGLAAGRLRVPAHGQGPPHLHGPRRPGRRGEDRAEQPALGRGAWSSSRASACLYVEGTLRAEYGALVDRFLAKDPDLEFCALVQTRPNVFVEAVEHRGSRRFESSPTTRRRSTVRRLHPRRPRRTYFRPEQQELLIKRVRAGAGLVMLGGYHSLGPGGYAGTPLGDILPVRAGRPPGGPDERPVPAPADARGRPPPDLRQHRRLLPHRLGGGRSRRAPAAGWLHPRRGRAARWPPSWPRCPRPTRAADARAGRSARRPGAHRRLLRRHHAAVAAGPSGRGPAVAVPTVLGPDGPLAGRARRGGSRPRPASWPAPTRPITSPRRACGSRPSSATSRAKAPAMPR